MSRVCLSADGCLLELWPCFAGLDALVPRVMKLGVIGTSAVSEPRTTATTTTDFSRFLDGTALRACQTDCRRRNCSCVHGGIHQKRENNHCFFWKISIYIDLALTLTFACLHTLVPPVSGVRVAATTTAFIPSTAGSATTDSAGFLESVTL